jgi:hypothetical protein
MKYIILQKMKPGSQPLVGTLTFALAKGKPITLEFLNGMHEYVTTPIVRILREVKDDVLYVQTSNSRYRLVITNVVSSLAAR